MYYINILLLIVYAAVLLWIRPTKGKKKIFCTLAAGNWILLSGLRHFSIGADTYAYQRAFYNSKFLTWHELWENFRNTFFRWEIFGSDAANEAGYDLFDLLWSENTLAVKDPGYALLNKAFYSIIPDYTAFLIFIAIIFTVPLAILIYKHSKEPLLSFLIYSCLFYSFFAITGHRQTIATGVALLGYLLFAERKQFIPFLLTVLLVYPLHKSVIGFVPIYFLQYVKMDRVKIAAVLIAFPIMFVFRGQLTTLLVNISGYAGYDKQYAEAGAYTFTLVYAVLMIAALWKVREVMDNDRKANTAFAAVAVAFLLTPTTFIDPSLMRLVQYYSIFLVLFVPDLVMAFKKEECVFVYLAATAVLIFLFAKNNPSYAFFWQ